MPTTFLFIFSKGKKGSGRTASWLVPLWGCHTYSCRVCTINPPGPSVCSSTRGPYCHPLSCVFFPLVSGPLPLINWISFNQSYVKQNIFFFGQQSYIKFLSFFIFTEFDLYKFNVNLLIMVTPMSNEWLKCVFEINLSESYVMR